MRRAVAALLESCPMGIVSFSVSAHHEPGQVPSAQIRAARRCVLWVLGDGCVVLPDDGRAMTVVVLAVGV